MPEEAMKGGRRLVLEWSQINLTKMRRRPVDRWDRDVRRVAGGNTQTKAQDRVHERRLV